MRQIIISEQVHNELVARVYGLSPEAAYIKGYLDGMIQGHNPRDFVIEVGIMPTFTLPAGIQNESSSPQGVAEELDIYNVDASIVACGFCGVKAGEKCQSRVSGTVYPDTFHNARRAAAFAALKAKI